MEKSNLLGFKIFVIIGFVAVKYHMMVLSLGNSGCNYGNTDFLLLMDNSSFSGITQVKQETMVCTYDIPQ